MRKLFLFIVAIIILTGCTDNPDRHLNLGNWYYQKGLLEEAILEYREVIRLYPDDPSLLTRVQLNSVTKAHYHLALAYSKKGWYDYALKEAKITFDLQPTMENREIIALLEKRCSLE